MRLFSFVIAMLIAPLHALASDSDTLAKAISDCWKPPAAMREARTLDAAIDDQGYGQFRVPGHDQTKIASDLVADSLLRAATRCAPYDVPAGSYRVTITPLDPFADRPNGTSPKRP